MNLRHAFLPACCAVVVASSGASRPGATVDWPSYNNDVASNRYATSTQITPANAGNVHVKCTAQLGMMPSFSAGPIVVGGVLYVTTTDNRTLALDAATCATRWSVTEPGPAHANRGAALAGGLLFRGFANGHVLALNASTGATVWDRSIIASGSLEYISAAPVVANGVVVIGTANGDGGQACRVVGLSAATGKILWTFQTVPNLGGPGSQSWKGATRIAGGGTWTSYSVDRATGRVYVPVGNPGPDFDVRKRKGANVDAGSVVELDGTTGVVQRVLSVDPDDDHDWDLSSAPAVVTLPTGKKIVLAAGKDGYLRSIDLATFGQSWQTAITTIANATAPITVQGTHFCPGGAVFWNGPAYSPQTGLAYVNAQDRCKTVDLSMTPQPYVKGQPWLGSTNGYGTLDPASSGWLNAVDATTGAMRWRYHAPAPLVAGVTPTAGGVVFTGDLAGNVLAFDATSGTQLAAIPVGVPIGGGIVSYETGGTQYIAVAAGFGAPLFGTPNQVDAQIVVLGL